MPGVNSAEYHGEGAAGATFGLTRRVDQHRAKQQHPGDGRRAPVSGADAHHHQNKAHQRAERRDGERDLEIAVLLAWSPLQHEERRIHHGEDEEKQKHGRRGELGDGAEQRERHGDEEEREDGKCGVRRSA